MTYDLLIATLPKYSFTPHLAHDCSNRLAVDRIVRMAGVGEELNLRVVGSTQGDLMIDGRLKATHHTFGKCHVTFAKLYCGWAQDF